MKTLQAFKRIKELSMNPNLNEVKQALSNWIEQGGDIKDNSFIDCGYPLLHYLIIFGRRDIEFVKYLQELGVDLHALDERGSNILQIASSLGNTEMVEYCLSLKIFNINEVNNDGYSALLYALESNHIAAAKCLVQYGADIENVKTSETQLNLLSDKRCLDMMLYLDSIGFDLRNIDIIPSPLIFDSSYSELLQCQSIGIMLQNILNLNIDGDNVELGNMIDEMNIIKHNFIKIIINNHSTQRKSCEFNEQEKLSLPILMQDNTVAHFNETEENLVKTLSGENSECQEQTDQHD